MLVVPMPLRLTCLTVFCRSPAVLFQRSSCTSVTLGRQSRSSATLPSSMHCADIRGTISPARSVVTGNARHLQTNFALHVRELHTTDHCVHSKPDSLCRSRLRVERACLHRRRHLLGSCPNAQTWQWSCPVLCRQMQPPQYQTLLLLVPGRLPPALTSGHCRPTSLTKR